MSCAGMASAETLNTIQDRAKRRKGSMFRDNARAETVNGLFKAELIHRHGPWRSFEAVEYATLEKVERFNNRRLLEPIVELPPSTGQST